MWDTESALYDQRLRSIPKQGAFLAVALFSLTILLIYNFGHRVPWLPSSTHPIYGVANRSNDHTIRRDEWVLNSDYDLVISHYTEDVTMLNESIQAVVSRIPFMSTHRVIIYSKDGRKGDDLDELLTMADEVVSLPNIGREGETYLSHIIRHYESAQSNLAGHTIFMQPHLAWTHIILPRLEHLLYPSTGFMSLGPYVHQQCGKDSQGNEFPRMADIYTAFTGELCPPHPVLATWAGQFVVSRKRILENRLKIYKNLWDLFHAPPEHWIWKEGWWNNQPSEPTLGHALERTWPVVFGCTDVKIEESCGEKHGTNCVCYD